MNKKYLVLFSALLALSVSTVFLLPILSSSDDQKQGHAPNQSVELDAPKELSRQLAMEEEGIVTKSSAMNTYFPALVKDSDIVFNVTSKAAGRMDSALFQNSPPRGLDMPIVLDSQGLLYLHVYEVKNNYWLLGGLLKMHTLTVNQVTQPYIDEIEHPFALSIRSNGEIFDLTFRENTNESGAEELIRLFLTQFQFISPFMNKLTWATNETDQNGSYSAKYQWLPFAVKPFWDLEKEIIHYAARPPQPSVGIPGMQLEALTSSRKMKVAKGDRWVDKINSAETTRLYMDGVLVNEMTGEFNAERTQQYAPYVFPKTLEILMAKIAKSNVMLASNNTLDKMAEGKNLEEALALFTTLLNDSNKVGLGREFIINYLRRYSQMSDELVDKLNQADSGLEQNTEVFLWYALAKAGMVLNQAALMGAAQDTSAPASTRMRALAAVHAIEAPVSNTVSALWGLENDSDKEVSNMAVLALGTFANKSIDVVGGSPDKLLDQLGDRLNASDEAADIKLYLTALNNSSNPASLVLIEPYLSHDDVIVRGEAFNATANVGTTSALERVFEYYETELDEAVKAKALNGLARYKTQALVNEWVVDLLNQALSDSDANASTKLPLLAIDMLGSSIAANSGNEQFLREWATKPLNGKLLKRIYQYVSP